MRPAFWALLLAAAALIAPCGSVRSCRADDSGAQPAEATGRTAVLVYIAWQELQGAVVDPTEFRLATAGYLMESLRSQGHVLVPQEDLSPLVTRWRIRSSLMLRDEFLAGLRDELGGDRLFLAQLILQPGRILIAWRLVDTVTGTVMRAGFSGSDLDQTNQWAAAAARAASAVLLPAGQAVVRAAGETLLFPVLSVGSDRGGTIVASHCLLEELVERRGLALPDPGLVVTTMQFAGFAATEMSAATRSLLQARFGSRFALVGELIAYDMMDSSPSGLEAMEPESVSPGLPQVDKFALNLTEIDLESGRVLASNEVYENRSVVEGWFGRQHRHPLLERLQNTVTELWTMNDRTLKDGGDDSPR